MIPQGSLLTMPHLPAGDPGPKYASSCQAGISYLVFPPLQKVGVNWESSSHGVKNRLVDEFSICRLSADLCLVSRWIDEVFRSSVHERSRFEDYTKSCQWTINATVA